MSWLISLVLAGVVFSTDTTVPMRQNNFTNNETTTTTRVVRLDETERFEQTYPLSPNGKVSISNVNGSIVIDTWDRNEVKLEAVKTADDKERLADVEIRIDARKDSISIETNYDSWKRNNGNGWKNYGKLNVDYRLTVPRNAVLDEVETVNGSVNITGSNNLTKASTVNGQVIATNLRGTAELSTVNGTIEANFDQLQSSSRINLDTVNGQVNLVIPSDANATVKADTLNGRIENDFGLPVRKGEYVGRDLYGRIGSGEVQIKLNSVNGGLYIKRKNDGKTVNPATNLLPAKNKNDDDPDIDVDVDAKVKIDTDQMNRDLQRAQVEMQRAQREMERVKPQIATIDKEKLKEKVREDMRRQADAMRLADINFFSGAPVIEKKSETFTVKGTPKVIVDAKSCDVSIRGWDKPEVQYAITRISRARNQKPIVYNVNRSDSEVKIVVTGSRDEQNREVQNEAERIRVEVFVPKKSDLRILSNREIRLENVSGEIDLTGSDEAINVRNVDGNLSVNARNGKIRVIGFEGEISAKTADGDMSLEGDFERITATTGSGNIIVTVADDVSAVIRANTDSVKLDGNLPSRVKTEDISGKSSVWRIGDSRAEYNFNVGDGQIFIRSINDLKAAL
jgi:DUF4097 and DUF4098 domain-containing protein YvlB